MANNLYTLESLLSFVQSSYQEVTTSGISFQKNDLSKSGQRDKLLQYDRDCACGDENDKLYIKQILYKIMTDCHGTGSVLFPASYGVNRNTIDKFIDWSSPKIDPYFKFLALLLYYKNDEDCGPNAFGTLIEKHRLNTLRADANGEVGFYVDADDIARVWADEKLEMTYDRKINVLTQLVYEEIKGNSCIDEIMYQNVGDISIGVSGIPGTLFAAAVPDYHHSYDTCWVRYHGCSIHLRFMTFGSYERMKDVVRSGVSYGMKGQFSEQEGFKLGYGKDGSRRSAAIEPFGESPALWVRKFTAKQESNLDLLSNLPGSNKVIDVEKILVKGGVTIPVCGAQGSGKTTKLEALTEYIQPFYSIRVMESEFEARLRWKYPNKNIFTVEANENTPVSPAEAYNFSLRTAGDIYIIGEARGDESIVNVTRTANRGGRSVFFTFHPNSPKATIPEVANALIRQKMYTNLKDAIATALDTVRCCIFIRLDMEAQCRYYEIYEFVPRPNGIPNDFMKISDPAKRNAAFMETMYRYMQHMTSADVYFDTVPIVKYDRKQKEYRFMNTISDGFFDELLEKSPLTDERHELMRVFRPQLIMDEALAELKVAPADVSREIFDTIFNSNHLNPEFLTYEQYKSDRKER